MSSIDHQVAILTQGAEFGDPVLAVRMKDELRQRLEEKVKSGQPLRVYCGYDVTGPDLHLGHTVTLRKLREFQNLGHVVTVLIGTFTAIIGDASDRDTARTAPSAEAIRENAGGYLEQIYRILDRERTSIRFNSEWLDELSFKNIIEFGSLFTVQQLLARDNFAKRYDKNDPIWLREFLYPLAQGYDAVALATDVQLGATEQLFNLMAGRKLQEYYGQRPQICLTFPILVGTDGKIRMSKSVGNYIGISEPPEVKYGKYGKTMSIPDSALFSYADLITRWSPEAIAQLKTDVTAGDLHPMEAKKRLAWEIVSGLDGDEEADRAAHHFSLVHQQRQLPLDMPEYRLSAAAPLVDVMLASGLTKSKSQAKRLIGQSAVRLNDNVVAGIGFELPHADGILQVGKRRFLKLVAA